MTCVVTRTRTFLNGTTAHARGTRLKVASGLLEVADANDHFVGWAESRIEANVYGAVVLVSAQGTVEMVAGAAIAVGAEIDYAAAGKIVTAAGAIKGGIAVQAAGADGDLIEVISYNNATVVTP